MEKNLKWKQIRGDRGWTFIGRNAAGEIKGAISFSFLSGGSGAAFVRAMHNGSATVTVVTVEGGIDTVAREERSNAFRTRAKADKWARAIARAAKVAA